MNSNDQERLRARLLELLMGEFNSLNESQLGMVFAQVLTDLRTKGIDAGAATPDTKKSPNKRPSVDKNPAPPTETSREARRPQATRVREQTVEKAQVETASKTIPEPAEPRKLFQWHSNEEHMVAYEFFSPTALEKFNQQIQTGGLFVKLEAEVELNAEIDVCVMLPAINEETWFEGRVVVQTPGGTGIDLKAFDSYKEVWDKAIKAMREGAAVGLKPSEGPVTAPPRLDRRGMLAGWLKGDEDGDGDAEASAEQDVVGKDDVPEVKEVRQEETPPSRSSAAQVSTHTSSVTPAHSSAVPSNAVEQHTAPAPPPASQAAAPPLGYAPPYLHNPAHGANPGYGFSGPPALSQAPLTAQQSIELASQSAALMDHDLSARPLVSLLVEASNQPGDGIIVIKCRGRTFCILMQVGCPVEFLQSPRNQDMELGPLLVQAKKLSWDEHKEIERTASEQGCNYGEAAVRLRLMSYQEILAGLQSRVAFAISQVLNQSEGRFTFHPLRQLPYRYSTPPLSLGHIVFKTTQKQMMKTPNLEHVIDKFLDTFPTKVSPPPCSVQELQLPQKEKRFFDVVFDTDHRLRFLLSISNINKSATMALLLTLKEMGFVEFMVKKERTEIHSKFIDRIKSKRKSLSSSNQFEVLEIHWTSYTELIRQGYLAQTDQFRLETLPENIREELKEDIDVINAALKEAHKELIDTKRRREYRDNLVNDMQVENGVSLYLRKGDLAMLRMDPEEARSCFKRVLELDPRNKQARLKLQKLTVPSA